MRKVSLDVYRYTERSVSLCLSFSASPCLSLSLCLSLYIYPYNLTDSVTNSPINIFFLSDFLSLFLPLWGEGQLRCHAQSEADGEGFKRELGYVLLLLAWQELQRSQIPREGFLGKSALCVGGWVAV